jgi:hypothetical protein
MSIRRSSVALLTSFAIALIGCSGGYEYPSRPAASPEAITAVLSRSADARPFALNNQDLTIAWAVTGSQEEKCAGTGIRITGSAVSGNGDFTHLGETTVSTSMAWNIGRLLTPDAVRYKAIGPASGPVAPVFGRGQYPYAFHYDPIRGACGPGVTATGKVVLTAANGDQVFGDVVGGETHKLDFIIDGDGAENFAEVAVTGGTGRFEGATGSFTVHSIARLGPTLKFVVTFAEVLPGGAIGY